MDFFNPKDNAQYICGVYLRVSTDMQDTSISNQQDYFDEYIKKMGFTLYDFYTDEALTGTETSKRIAWQSLIKDGIAGKYNVLLAKSFSRFGRNQQQTLLAISELIKNNVRIIFIEDSLDSMKDFNNFGLFAWLAEQEARKTSSRIKMTWDLYDQQGKIHACHESYGYNYDTQTNNFILNEEEAVIIRRIFSMYIDLGHGFTKIANILQEEGIKTKKGGEWANATIASMLRNQIYIGTLIQGKSKSIDVTIKKRNKVDKDKWSIHENRIEPIINEETFYKAQLQMQNRNNKYERHSTSALFSNLIKCDNCGSSFTIKRQKHFKNYSPYYTCINYDLNGVKISGHSRIAIYEKDLIDFVMQTFNDIRDDNYKQLKEINTLDENKCEKINYDKELKKINKKIKDTNSQSMKLLTLLTDGIIKTTQYKLQNEQLEIQIENLTKEKDQTLLSIENEKYKNNNNDNTKNAIEFLINTEIEEWTNALLKQCIKNITIDIEKTIIINLNKTIIM